MLLMKMLKNPTMVVLFIQRENSRGDIPAQRMSVAVDQQRYRTGERRLLNDLNGHLGEKSKFTQVAQDVWIIL